MSLGSSAVEPMPNLSIGAAVVAVRDFARRYSV